VERGLLLHAAQMRSSRAAFANPRARRVGLPLLAGGAQVLLRLGGETQEQAEQPCHWTRQLVPQLGHQTESAHLVLPQRRSGDRLLEQEGSAWAGQLRNLQTHLYRLPELVGVSDEEAGHRLPVQVHPVAQIPRILPLTLTQAGVEIHAHSEG